MALIHQTPAGGRLLIRATRQDHIVRLLQSGLHRGEAERIVLGLELSAGFVLMDKKDGSQAAERTDRRVLGVLLRARGGEIPLLKPAIEALRTMAGFYVLPRLEKEV
jgi:predicted nucleic acid-binding protein